MTTSNTDSSFKDYPQPTRSYSSDFNESKQPVPKPGAEKRSKRAAHRLSAWYNTFHEWRYTPLALIFAVILLVFFSALGSYLGYRASVQLEKGDGMGSDLGQMTSGMALYGSVTDVDIDEKKLEMRFSFSGCGPGYTNDAQTAADCGVLNRNITTYINENATLSKFESKSEIDHEAVFLRDGAVGFYEPDSVIWSRKPEDMSTLELTFTPSFQVEIPFDWTESRSSLKSDPTSYPFDEYSAYITFLAWDAGSNVSEPDLGQFSAISFVRTSGTFPNYVISSVDYATLENDVRRTIKITIRRSNAVRAFAISIIVMLWALTIAIVWAAVVAVIYRRPVMGETYVVTSAALFAIPEVRDKLPAAPAFGIFADSFEPTNHHVMDKSPLIFLQTKSTEDVDFNYGIKTTIANVYGEDPSNYTDPVAALNRFRQDATRGSTTDATGKDLLQSYYGQLEMLELRFPELRVTFNWRDIFTAQDVSQHSLAYEKASVLFNLATTYSVLASSSNRSDPEGIKTAFYNTRVAAGLWDYIANNFLHAPSTDLSRDVVRFLSALMLAQAQEIFLEKTVEEKTRGGRGDGKSMGIVAKLASQCSFQYNSLLEPVRENVNKSIFDRHWWSFLQIKSNYFASQTQYYRAMVDNASDKHGEAIARVKLAESLAKESYRLGSTFNTFFAPCDTLPADVSSVITSLCKAHQTKCTEYKNELIKENDLIFHEAIPAENLLSTVDKLNAANAVTITEIYQNPEVQKSIGSDLFANLVPFSVHEAASIYSEEKAKIIRAVTETVEVTDTELEAAIEHLGLPGSLRKFVQSSNEINYDVSGEIKQLAKTIYSQESSGGVSRQISTTETKRERILADLNWISNELDIESKECEQARMQHANFSQSPSARQTKEWRQQLKAHYDGLEKAGKSDASIKQVYQYIDADVRLLNDSASDLDDSDNELALYVKDYVSSQTPSHTRQQSLLDVDVGIEEHSEQESRQMTAYAREITRLVDALKGLKKFRSQHIQVLRQKIQNDDVSHLLILNRKAQHVETDMFGSELDKFKEDQKIIEGSIADQLKILEELNGAWIQLTSSARAKEIHTKHAESDRRRKEVLKKFKKAGDTYFEAANGVSRAMMFYEDLENAVRELKRDVDVYVNSRAKERVQAVIEAEAAGAGGSSFENEFSRLGVSTPHRPPKPGTTSPPTISSGPPASSTPSSASYGYGGMPAPPPQPQPSIYQSLYGQQRQSGHMPQPPPKPASPYYGAGYASPPPRSPYGQHPRSPYNQQPPNNFPPPLPQQFQNQTPYSSQPSQPSHAPPPTNYQQYYQQAPPPNQNYPYYR
ncbi:hypothetical protein E3P98_03929 [Wallemia ichthyophaga]|nr:hypothetical protein E3P98_03929 [Wallemia ichthyophaga]